MGKAMACLKDSIQAPGFGKRLIQPGTKERTRYGMANPKATKVKTAKAGNQSIAKAAPTATPRKGAMQGVATTTANTPEKKDPA